MSTATSISEITYDRLDGQGKLTVTSEPDWSRAEPVAMGLHRVPNTWVVTDDEGNQRRFPNVPAWLDIVRAECVTAA